MVEKAVVYKGWQNQFGIFDYNKAEVKLELLFNINTAQFCAI